ncbi:MAG: hypothetical protein HDS68_02595 [Bacteroidales bacterium]|nr:hypothetical protein [Bacteroidales bacterium]
MSKCRTHKCKAACCHNIALPIGFLAQFASKIVTPVISASPAPYNHEFPPSEFVSTSTSLMHNKCPFLRADHKCNVYEHRPAICRRFGDGSHPLLTCGYLKN